MGNVKQIDQGFKGMITDLNSDIIPKDFYKHAFNIRLNTSKDIAQGGFTFEKGNKLILALSNFTMKVTNGITYLQYGTSTLFPLNSTIDGFKELFDLFSLGNNKFKVSGVQEIIEVLPYPKGLILFATDSKGFDSIWDYNTSTDVLTFKYIRNLGFNKINPIQAIYNFENDIIEKVYWIDGINQLRFINLKHSVKNGDNEDLIYLPQSSINQVGLFNISQPKVEKSGSGGRHTAGMIQYAYNLYKINGNQTKLSPLSIIIPLGDSDGGGGAINQIVTDLPFIQIQINDKNYSNIKVYSIKYTSKNQLPEVNVIEDRTVGPLELVKIYDTGTKKLQTISLEELAFLGSDPIYPKHIQSKDNHLFLANYKESTFRLKNLDTRLFGFNSNNRCLLANKFKISTAAVDGYEIDYTGKVLELSGSNLNNLPAAEEGYINSNVREQNRLGNSNSFGGSGKFFQMRMDRAFVNYFNQDNYKINVLKDNELYRFAVKFYNKYGQTTEPMWLFDYFTFTSNLEETNLSGHVIQPIFSINPSFYSDYYSNNNNFLDDNGIYDENLKPVGYKILRAIRDEKDRLVISQGFVNPMMSCNPYVDIGDDVELSAAAMVKADNGFKMPWLMRTYSDLFYPMRGMGHGKLMNEGYFNPNGVQDKYKSREVFSSVTKKTTSSFQYSKMMQFYSPDITFGEINAINTDKFKIVGGAGERESSVWVNETDADSGTTIVEAKILNRLSVFANEIQSGLNDREDIALKGEPTNLFDYGLLGPTGGNSMHKAQFFRDFTGSFRTPVNRTTYRTLKNPIIAEKGQSLTSYHGVAAKYSFYNNLGKLRTDTPKQTGGSTSDPKGRDPILRVMTDGARCATFLDVNELSLEYIKGISGITAQDVTLILEFIRELSQYYLGSIYNGFSFESLKLTPYTEVGEYFNINDDEKFIDNIGDTFVGEFRLERLSPKDQSILATDTYYLSEIVYINLETSINLRLRNDLSKNMWDEFFLPKESDYQRYNPVYSQQNNLFKDLANAYNFKELDQFSNRIITTKKKNSGELIDSWTDVLVNNFMDLNGRYGAITGMDMVNDNLIARQESAVAMISVNPRVQVVGDDGISTELGTGTVLHDYKYISTQYGTSEKYAAISTPNGLYYYDSKNKALLLFASDGLMNITKTKLVSSTFNELFKDNLKLDNKIFNGSSVTMGYDPIMNDVYLVFKNLNCIAFNEVQEYMSGFYSYESPKIVSQGGNTFSLNRDKLSQLYLHNAGVYNNFYGKNVGSEFKFTVNPEPLVDNVFTNMSFKLEAYKDNKLTEGFWESIQASNEYQDSKEVSLISRVNYRKMNRMYSLNIPRVKNTRDRMRNNWVDLTLRTNNSKGLLIRNHPIIINYVPMYRQTN